MYVPWHEGVWRSGCKALRIPNSGIRWRRIVTFTFRLIFPQGNIPPYLFGKNTVGRMDCLETFLDEITCSKNWANRTVITSRKRGLARHVARIGKMINAYDVGREHLLLLTLLRSGIAQGAPCTATISDVLCVSTRVLIILDSCARAFCQLPADTPSSVSGGTWREMAVNFAD
jgi:hypothetical protein